MLNILSDKTKPIILDACIFMVGINEPYYNFENTKCVFLDSCFNYFDKILIHKIVFDELDNNSQKYVMEKKKSGN